MHSNSGKMLYFTCIFIATKADVPFSSNEHTQHKSNINSNRFQLLQFPTTSILQKRWILLICWSISASMLNIANELGWITSMANKINANRIHWKLADAWLDVMHSSAIQSWIRTKWKIVICFHSNMFRNHYCITDIIFYFWTNSLKFNLFFISDWVPSLTKKFLQMKLKMLGPSL